MKKSVFYINNIPAVLYGESSDSVYLFIHGQSGCKEEAERFAAIACPEGWQVLGIDLPEHGERRGESGAFNPWHAVPELKAVMKHIKAQWKSVSIRANSIGAWFSMLAFQGENIQKCLFVSPILDMNELISNMMLWANVSEERLRKEKIILTDFGNALEWQYFEYAKANPIEKWDSATCILYPEHDNLTSRQTVNGFSQRFGCRLTVAENCEHWFHTPEQLAALDKWTQKEIL